MVEKAEVAPDPPAANQAMKGTSVTYNLMLPKHNGYLRRRSFLRKNDQRVLLMWSQTRRASC